jgi:diguanylate cyclase (GGDEF)-like protein
MGQEDRPEAADRRRGSRRATFDRDSADWGIMLRSLMVIWGVGATFFFVVLVGSRPPAGTRTVLLCMNLVAFAVLGLLSAGQDRLPWWTPDLCAYLLTLVVGGVILSFENPDSPYAFFYLWLSVHSFYFLPWRRAAPQVAFIAVDYAVSLWAIPGADFPFLRWTVTVMTTVVICALVALLRMRVDELVGRLADAARTDPLTGLRNRRAYDEVMDVEIARADRTGRPLCLVIGDLDHFKRINDRYGHPTGDVVLRRVAAQLDGAERKTDVVARLGGEEFAIVLPDTDAQGAYLVAERLRHAIRRAFHHRGPSPVTMSFGIASYPEDGANALALFAAADTALLAAKNSGRDRSVVYCQSLGRQPIGGPARGV